MTATQLETAGSTLAYVADVASRLSADGEIVRRTMDVIEHTVATLGAAECSLWLSTANGLMNAARAGSRSTPAEELAAWFDTGDVDEGNFAVRRLEAGTRRLGALVLRMEGGVPADAATAFTAVARMLSQALHAAEQSRAFTAEVERRTRQLDDERRFIHHVVDSLPVSLYVIDREYRIVAWNRKREAGSQGVRREQALGRTIFEILHRAPAEKLRREFDDVFRSGRIQQFEMHSRGSGDPRTYRITKIPMQLAEGEPISHVITIGEDVTDSRATPERLQAFEKLATIGQYAIGALRPGDPPALAPDFAASLSAFVQTPTDGLRRRVDLNQLVTEAIALVRTQSAFSAVSVQPILEAGMPDALGMPDELRQVIAGLLQNAAEAMPGGGSVSVRTRAAGQLVVEVIDAGAGIARTDLPRIFEPFFTTRTTGRGTGLSLSTCYAIISSHGGRIEVDSAVGVGSTFRLFLPGVPSND
jgi:two-component system NtrC family sensor kinase